MCVASFIEETQLSVLQCGHGRHYTRCDPGNIIYSNLFQQLRVTQEKTLKLTEFT